MIEIDEVSLVFDLSESLFWYSDTDSETEELRKEISEQLVAQMMGWC